jgi:putative cardiolipin synthase
VEALSGGKPSHAALNEHRDVLNEQHQQLKAGGVDYVKRVAIGEPFDGMVSGRLPLIWAPAQLVYDSPDKQKVEKGAMVGRLMQRPVANATLAVQSELLMVTPYLIPGNEGMRLFKNLRQRSVRVRILTSSLESTTVLLAHSGYMHYRVPLLENGVELYEIRSLLGNIRGSGQTTAISRFGNYSLHAKLFVFDRKKVFIGSMNFDQRSMHLNTEIGLIIDSPTLAKQIAERFDAMVQPVNSYQLLLRPSTTGRASSLVWLTQEDGKAVEYNREPARSDWQRIKVNMLSLLPLDKEL